MGLNVAQVIRQITREHLLSGRGKLFGQCVTAVGWVAGTIPELSENEGIIELSMADVAGAGIAVGAALVPGQRPIYVIRYQGFLWYNAAPILNYAAKSKEMWGVPCPLAVRAIAMEGGIGPVASASHHFMALHMPGINVYAPMTPNEWTQAWEDYLRNDDPVFFSEHRRSYSIDYEFDNILIPNAEVSLIGISAARIEICEAGRKLEEFKIKTNIIHLVRLKPLIIDNIIVESIKQSKFAMVIDSDYEYCGASQSIAYSLMHLTGKPVYAMGLENRTAGFAPHLDNKTPSADKIVSKCLSILKK